MITEESSANPRTTRHIRCTPERILLLEEDFGIDAHYLTAAFMGVPPAPFKQTIALCEWAVSAANGDPEEAGDALRAWAKKRGTGQYSPVLLDAPPVTYGEGV